MRFRIKADKKKGRSEYRMRLLKVSYWIPPWVYLELNGDKLRLYNSFGDVYHQFDDGEDVYELTEGSLRNLQNRLEKDFEIVK